MTDHRPDNKECPRNMPPVDSYQTLQAVAQRKCTCTPDDDNSDIGPWIDVVAKAHQIGKPADADGLKTALEKVSEWGLRMEAERDALQARIEELEACEKTLAYIMQQSGIDKIEIPND